MNKIQEKEQELKEKKSKRLAEIKTETNGWKRFWKYVGFWLGYIWIVIWNELKDWRTAVVFLIVCTVISIEVWLPMLIGIITNNSYLKGIAGICWAFWLLPGTPFLPLCLVITLFIMKFVNKRRK